MTLAGIIGIGLGAGIVTAMSKAHKTKSRGKRLLIAISVGFLASVCVLIGTIVLQMFK